MPVNNTKGLQTDIVYYTQNFESGDLSMFDYVSSTPAVAFQIVTSPSQGTYAFKSTNDPTGDPSNPFPNSPQPEAHIAISPVGPKLRSFSIKFNFQIPDGDDPGFVGLSDTGSGAFLVFTPARQGDPTRRFYINGFLYGPPLSAGSWYTFNATEINFNTQTFDFEVRDSGDTQVLSDTNMAFLNTTNEFGYISFANQLNSSTSNCTWDDIVVTGLGI